MSDEEWTEVDNVSEATHRFKFDKGEFDFYWYDAEHDISREIDAHVPSSWLVEEKIGKESELDSTYYEDEIIFPMYYDIVEEVDRSKIIHANAREKTFSIRYLDEENSS